MSYTHWLMCIILATVFVSGLGYFPYLHYRAKYKLNAAVLFGVFFGFVAGLLLVHAIVFFKDFPTETYNELACLAGASLGWLFGMWLSPMGSNESTKFSRYGTVIGVGSGFTLKWAMERVSEASPWIKSHPLVCLLFAVSLLVTTAAVYNSRAYEDSLTISPRKTNPAIEIKNGFVLAKPGTKVAFYATCIGPSDPLASWEVIPADLGTVDASGVFTAGKDPGTGRITAFNVENPSLSNAIAVEVAA